MKGHACRAGCGFWVSRGLTVHVTDAVLCYATPSALNNIWELKWGPSLHSPWAMSAASLAIYSPGPS